MGNERTEGFDERRDRQLGEEAARVARFRLRHSRLSRLPMLGPAACVVYAQKPSRLLALLAILVVFTALKAPHMGRSFTGDHSLKYSSYVEPAMYMAEFNDPLRYQLPYQADPENPSGRRGTFGSLPLMEWGLYLTYEIFGLEDLEHKTRLFTHLVGLSILLLGYFFFRRWVPAELALLTILLTAFNPIVAFATYVTVNDSLLIFWMFVSLLLVNRFLVSGQFRHVYLAGIAGGIGVAVKLSLFLWLVPIVAILLLTDRRVLRWGIAATLLFGTTTVLPLVAVQTSVLKLPSDQMSAGLLTMAWALGFLLLYIVLAMKQEQIDSAIERKRRSPWVLPSVVASTAALAVFAVLQLGLMRWVSGFLTDLNLLFEPRLYLYMASEQFRDYLTPPVAYLAGAGGMVLLLARWSDAKRLFLGLVGGCLVYWIVASKVMFFHNYYTVILMITAAFAAGALIYDVLRRFTRPSEKVALALLCTGVFLRPAMRATDQILGLEEDISALVEFVEQNTTASDLLLHEGYYSAVGIYARRSLVRTYRLATPAVREDIAAHGFKYAMHSRSIKYLITPFDHPSYRDFAPVFEPTLLRAPTYDRSYNICTIVNLDCPGLKKKHEELDRIVIRHDIPSRFRLVTEVGKFKIYSFEGLGLEKQASPSNRMSLGSSLAENQPDVVVMDGYPEWTYSRNDPSLDSLEQQSYPRITASQEAFRPVSVFHRIDSGPEDAAGDAE